MLVTETRPRNLKWYHAGPLLYGDWGTSRLYVLGLAFYFTAHASILFLAAIGLLMAAVAWAYTIVCRCFPEGGGVYSAARQLNRTWSFVGATLLIGGYIVTVAISMVEAYHYFGVPGESVVPLAAITIVLLGVVNWLGARSAGRFALAIAFAAVIVSIAIAVLCIPFFAKGLRSISLVGVGTPSEAWIHFTRICLAMSGVEAVANMTGLMRQPVISTARRTIWPVLIEVVLLNLLFGIAIAGLPQAEAVTQPAAITYGDQPPPPEVVEFRDTAMRELAAASGGTIGSAAGSILGITASIVFGLLLISAANTAIMALVSVLYSMAQDHELPRALTRLNYSGVPWVGLIFACIAPVITIAVTRDVAVLAQLYIIGVFGAVTTSIMAVAMNRSLDISPRQRAGLWALGGFLSLLSITVVVTLPPATGFAGGLVAVALLVRMFVQKSRRAHVADALPAPAAGWLSELQEQPLKLDPNLPRIMLASRGRYQSEFAVDLARRRKATLFAIYVRTLRLMDINPASLPKLADDPVAQEALGTTAVLAREAGVPFVPIYVTSEDISGEILDYTVTFGCDTLIMGKSRRSLLSRRVQGDVVARVAENLPDEVALITRSADQPHLGATPSRSAETQPPAPHSSAPISPADPDTTSGEHIGHA